MEKGREGHNGARWFQRPEPPVVQGIKGGWGMEATLAARGMGGQPVCHTCSLGRRHRRVSRGGKLRVGPLLGRRHQAGMMTEKSTRNKNPRTLPVSQGQFSTSLTMDTQVGCCGSLWGRSEGVVLVPLPWHGKSVLGKLNYHSVLGLSTGLGSELDHKPGLKGRMGCSQPPQGPSRHYLLHR